MKDTPTEQENTEKITEQEILESDHMARRKTLNQMSTAITVPIVGAGGCYLTQLLGLSNPKDTAIWMIATAGAIISGGWAASELSNKPIMGRGNKLWAEIHIGVSTLVSVPVWIMIARSWNLSRQIGANTTGESAQSAVNALVESHAQMIQLASSGIVVFILLSAIINGLGKASGWEGNDSLKHIWSSIKWIIHVIALMSLGIIMTPVA